MKISLKKAREIKNNFKCFTGQCLVCNGQLEHVEYDLYGCRKCGMDYIVSIEGLFICINNHKENYFLITELSEKTSWSF